MKSSAVLLPWFAGGSDASFSADSWINQMILRKVYTYMHTHRIHNSWVDKQTNYNYVQMFASLDNCVEKKVFDLFIF